MKKLILVLVVFLGVTISQQQTTSANYVVQQVENFRVTGYYKDVYNNWYSVPLKITVQNDNGWDKVKVIAYQRDDKWVDIPSSEADKISEYNELYKKYKYSTVILYGIQNTVYFNIQ